MFLFFQALPACLEKIIEAVYLEAVGQTYLFVLNEILVILYSSGNTQCIDETGNVALYHIMGSSTFAMIE